MAAAMAAGMTDRAMADALDLAMSRTGAGNLTQGELDNNNRIVFLLLLRYHPVTLGNVVHVQFHNAKHRASYFTVRFTTVIDRRTFTLGCNVPYDRSSGDVFVNQDLGHGWVTGIDLGDGVHLKYNPQVMADLCVVIRDYIANKYQCTLRAKVRACDDITSYRGWTRHKL
jgi:hypothetical protein